MAPHKCAYTIFTKNRRLETEEGFNLKLYNVEIPRDNHPIFLGLRFDPSLSMNRHMTYIAEKAKDRLNVLRILSYYESWRINKKILVNIYISLTRSLFEYMSFIFVKLSNSNKETLCAIQNNALRIIFKKKIDECSIEELHNLAKIPRLETGLKALTNKYYWNSIQTNNPVIVDLVDEFKLFYKDLQIDEKLATTNYSIEMIRRDNAEIVHQIKSKPITLLCHVENIKSKLWPNET